MMIKVFDALEEALKSKDMLLEAYREQNSKLLAEIRELKEGMKNANSDK